MISGTILCHPLQSGQLLRKEFAAIFEGIPRSRKFIENVFHRSFAYSAQVSANSEINTPKRVSYLTADVTYS